MNSMLGQRERVEAIHPVVKSSRLFVLGRRLISLLKWCVIATVLIFGFMVAVAHVLARTSEIPPMQTFVAYLYTADIWWHPTDKAYAKVLLRKAVAAGDIKAQYQLALDYEDEKSYAEAFALHQDLALKGFTDSQRRLGLMYMNGRGVSQNTAVAIRWLKSAAAQGDAAAHYFIGWMYLGELPDMPQDLSHAIQWFQSSANLGDGAARNALARCYAKGIGVPEDLEVAMQWANRSLDAGYGSAHKTIQLIQTIRAEKGK